MKIETVQQLEKALDKNRDLIVEGDLEILINIEWSHKVRNIRSGGLLKCKRLHWSHYAMPKAKTIACEIVIPKCGDRTHWEERLGIDCSGDESKALVRNAPLLKKLLRKKQWSKTERWMMQSWVNYVEVSANAN